MIRPLHVLDTVQFAGTEQHVLSLATAQARRGQSPAVACRPGGGLFERVRAAAGVDVVELSGTLASPRAVWQLVHASGSGPTGNRFDLLHAHNGRSLLAGAIAHAGRGLPVVMTQHFLDPAHSARTGVRRVVSDLIHRACAAGTSQVIAVSALAGDRMIARGECPAGKLTVVHNGIADPRQRLGRSPEPVRAELGVSGEVRLVVCAARLETEKRVDVLIGAMARVCAVHRQAVCVVAGQGTLQATLQEQVAAAGLQSQVRLLGFRDDVPDLIVASDVFVLPSPAEPFGLVLLEAMGLGKPTIACAAGGPLEIVEPGVTGWLVPPLDEASLAEAILHALSDPAERARRGIAARARYEREFTDDHMAAGTAAVYSKAVRREG